MTSTNLSSDNEAFIADAVARGNYRDRTDVLEAGAAMLRRHEQLLAMIDEGRRQLDEGDYVEFDDDELREFASSSSSAHAPPRNRKKS